MDKWAAHTRALRACKEFIVLDQRVPKMYRYILHMYARIYPSNLYLQSGTFDPNTIDVKDREKKGERERVGGVNL